MKNTRTSLRMILRVLLMFTAISSIYAENVSNKTNATSAPNADTSKNPLVPKDPSIIPDNIEKPLKVGVSLVLNNLISLDEKQGTFEADVDFTLTWNNTNEAFDPKTVGTSIKYFDEQQTPEALKTMWYPEITISNMEKIVNDVPLLSVRSDGTIVYIQRIKALFKINPELRAFPFDSQSLTFYLEATKNTSSEVKFTQSQTEINHSGVRPAVSLSGWELKEIEFSHSLGRSISGGFYPRFEAKISMDRISMPHLFAFAPLFLIMLSPTIMTLFSESTLGSRLTAWGGSLLTLIATMFALNQKYPALESDSILTQITSIILGYQFLMILLSMSFLNPSFAKRFRNPYMVSEMISYIRWSIPALTIILVLTCVLLAVIG
jgi:hypothetical protein